MIFFVCERVLTRIYVSQEHNNDESSEKKRFWNQKFYCNSLRMRKGALNVKIRIYIQQRKKKRSLIISDFS